MPPNKKRHNKDMSRANWSKETLHIFCDLCIEHAERSKRKHGGIIRMQWKILEVDFQKKTSLAYGRNKLKNKWDWMRNKWILWKTLKGEETGLGWDHEKGTLSASDEWWKKKIEENMHFKPFQDEGIEPKLENKMEQLFGEALAQRVHKITPITICSQLTQREKETIDTISPPRSLNDGNGPCDRDDEMSENNVSNHIEANMKWQEFCNSDSPNPSPTPQQSTKHVVTGRGSKRVLEIDASDSTKRSKMEFALMEKLDAIAKVVSQRIIKAKELVNREARPLADSDHTLVDSLALLVAMPNLIHGSPEFCFACTLIEDAQKRTILHGIPDDYSRLQWIKFLYERSTGTSKNQTNLT